MTRVRIGHALHFLGDTGGVSKDIESFTFLDPRRLAAQQSRTVAAFLQSYTTLVHQLHHFTSFAQSRVTIFPETRGFREFTKIQYEFAKTNVQYQRA